MTLTLSNYYEALGDVKQFGRVSKRLLDSHGGTIYIDMVEKGLIERTSYGAVFTAHGLQVYNVMSKYGAWSPEAVKVLNGPRIASNNSAQ